MKTLAELKREANSGKLYLELIERYGATGDGIPEALRGIRYVKGANSVALNIQNKSGQESELRIERAALMEYTGETLTIYEAGLRDRTEQEQQILAGWAKEEAEYCRRYPWADTFWQRKRYFQNSECPWMEGTETQSGKCYVPRLNKVRDYSIKGDAILKYRVIREQKGA